MEEKQLCMAVLDIKRYERAHVRAKKLGLTAYQEAFEQVLAGLYLIKSLDDQCKQ